MITCPRTTFSAILHNFFSLKGETMAAETFKSNFKARICARIERDIWNPWSRMLMRFKSTSSQSMAWITRSTKGCNDPVHYVWTMSQFSIVKDVSMTTFFFLSLEQLKHHCSPQSPHVKFHLYYYYYCILFILYIIYRCLLAYLLRLVQLGGHAVGQEVAPRRMRVRSGDECCYESDNRHWGEKWPCSTDQSLRWMTSSQDMS